MKQNVRNQKQKPRRILATNLSNIDTYIYTYIFKPKQ